MKATIGISTILAATLSVACAANVDDSTSNSTPTTQTKSKANTVAAPARDGNIAIMEEFEQSKKQGTVEAMELFIQRHPDHDLIDDAQAHIKTLMARGVKRKT